MIFVTVLFALLVWTFWAEFGWLAVPLALGISIIAGWVFNIVLVGLLAGASWVAELLEGRRD